MHKIDKNRQKLQSIIKCVIFCGKQNIPLRDHRDDSQYLMDTNQNPDIFQSPLEIRVVAGDYILK